jgi:DNA-binding NtrC family response regulator
MTRLLLVDDDAQLRAGMSAYLRRLGLEVFEAGSCAEGRQLQVSESPDLTIVDYDLPDGTAFDVLESMREREASDSAIVLTGVGTIDLAVKAIKSGAEHFLTKPVDFDSLVHLIERTVEAQRQRRQNTASKLGARTALDPFLGTSRRIQELRELSTAVLGSDAPVLIQGETGSGKGVLARWLHDHGRRSDEPFVDLNCAGLSHDLVASELFGHQRGAFTGAVSNKPGLIEVANKGTLFLDEIGDLDPLVQPKLLKALEERTFRRVGDVALRASDVRVLGATHHNLAALVQAGRFREDLRFRINTLTIEIPPLRERPEDIGEIARTLLGGMSPAAPNRLGARGDPSQAEITEEAFGLLCAYRWPGNIRELRNVLERALLFRKGSAIDRRSLHFDRVLEPDSGADAPRTLDEAERQHISDTLQRLGGRVEDAAKVLAISRSALYAKLKKYGIGPSAG